METITFTANLERNIRMMQELFRNDDTLIIRRAIGQNGLRCALFFFDGMVNSLAINQSLVRPILRCEQPRLSADILAAAVLQADECRVETDMNKVFAAFLYGDAIVLTDGDARPVLVNTKGFDKRSTAEPARGLHRVLYAQSGAHPPPRERPSAEIPVYARRQPHEHQRVPVLYRRTV